MERAGSTPNGERQATVSEEVRAEELDTDLMGVDHGTDQRETDRLDADHK